MKIMLIVHNVCSLISVNCNSIAPTMAQFHVLGAGMKEDQSCMRTASGQYGLTNALHWWFAGHSASLAVFSATLSQKSPVNRPPRPRHVPETVFTVPGFTRG